MVKLDYDDTMALFYNLKKSIDEFYAKNSHLEESGVFSLGEVLRNCAKMDHFLNKEFEHLWRMERDEARELREKLETVPVEINHPTDESENDNFDDMPPLVKDPFYDMPALITCKKKLPLVKDPFYDMPALIPCNEEPSLIEQNADDAFCEVGGDISAAFEVKPPSSPTILRTSIWNWAPSYTSDSALAFSQQVRDL